MSGAVADETEELHGDQCILVDLSRAVVCPSAGPTPVSSLHHQLATEVHKTSRPWTARDGRPRAYRPKTVLKHV
jgi:hypothetical protein